LFAFVMARSMPREVRGSRFKVQGLRSQGRARASNTASCLAVARESGHH